MRTIRDYQYGMGLYFDDLLNKWKLTLRRLDPRAVVIVVCAVSAIAFGLHICTSTEIADFARGDIADLWVLIRILAIFSCVTGACCALVTIKACYQSLLAQADAPWCSVSRYTSRLIKAYLAACVAGGHFVLAVDVLRDTNFHISSSASSGPPPLLSSVCWPTGRSPRIDYECA